MSVFSIEMNMHRLGRQLLLLVALAAFAGARTAAAQTNDVAQGWKLEELRTLDGRTYRGLIRGQVGREIEFVEVVRPSNKPMYLVVRPLEVKTVVSQTRLDDGERRQLIDRVDAFRNHSVIEAGRMENVQVTVAEADGAKTLQYSGPWFSLESTADDETTRRSIVRIEQIFRAYRQILPPRTRPKRELRVFLFGSLEEYREYLHDHELEISNPAFFAEKENLIVAASDLTEYSTRLAQARVQHREVRAKMEAIGKGLDLRLAELRKSLAAQGVPKDQIDDEMNARRNAWQAEYDDTLARLAAADRRNDARFADVTDLMFRRLYHEGLHAYLENYVYPHKLHDVPIWLNEGLAQIFQSGQLDGDALRIDAPLRGTLETVQADLKSEKPLRLDEMLTAGRREFLAGAEAEGRTAKLYAYAWAVAYFLTFNEGLLRSRALDDYVTPHNEKMGTLDKFEELTGQSLAEFESRWRAEVLRLRPR